MNRPGTIEQPVIFLAGGGTGGHLFPLVAVADALRELSDVRVIYIGTARGIETRVVPARGDELELLDVRPLKGRGISGAVQGMAKAAATLPSARALIRRLSPRAVLSAGGYAAGPVGLVAALSRVPLAILVPDSTLGLTNRWLLPFARRAYVAFPEVEKGMRPGVARRTGVPLRGSFRPSPYHPSAEAFRILVLGGSQGSKALNEILPPAFALARKELPMLSVLHQSGRDREEELRARYRELGAEAWAEVHPFVDDVAGALGRADLVIQRAGAGSLAEACAVGRPCLLIPLPTADDHQRKNADSLAAMGAAVSIVQKQATPERVAAEVVAVARDIDRRVRMAKRAEELGAPDAARVLARDLLAFAGIAQRGNEDSGPEAKPSDAEHRGAATTRRTRGASEDGARV
jgi:UDP-N-acetylglucosamine--N-acetylmuramyl-(pentapeptide) pyrophosphoryl-undecaprenol N-acetylglucosamine transferase